jgi:voltage-gated potassium channel
MKEQLYVILEDNTTKKGRYFDYFIQTLIFLSLISFSLDTLPSLPLSLRQFLKRFEIFSIIVFSADGDSDGFKHSVLQLSVGFNF